MISPDGISPDGLKSPIIKMGFLKKCRLNETANHTNIETESSLNGSNIESKNNKIFAGENEFRQG